MFHRSVIPGASIDLQVIGRADAMCLNPDRPHLVVSISEPRAPEARYPDSPHRLGILRLRFHDAAVPLPDRTLITPEEARSIVEFVEQQRAEARLVVCQCEGGISRSAGVAAALSKWLNGDNAAFFLHYQPNPYVYQTVLEAAMPPSNDPLTSPSTDLNER